MYIGEIKKEARERFALNRYQAMLVYGVVYTLALNIAVLTTVLFLLNKWAIWYGIILIFLFLLMLAPFGYGMTGFYVKLYRFEKVDAFHVFDGFNKYNLERVIVLRLLKFALWLAFTVLLIVPGIIFSLRTCMATYILRAHPDMKPQDALKMSNALMKKHCGKYFGLSLSFIGWYFMGLVTCGLGYIWVLPYFNAAKVVFYQREIQGDEAVYRNPIVGDTLVEAHETETEAEIASRVRLQDEIRRMDAQLHPTSVEAQRMSSPEIVTAEEPRAAQEAVSFHHEEIVSPSVVQSQAVSDKPSAVFVAPHEEPFLSVVPDTETYAENTEPLPPVHANNDAIPAAHSVGQERTESRRREALAQSEGRQSHERTADTLRRAEIRPLPGGRVVIDSEGRRVASSRPSAGAIERESRRAENRTETVRPTQPRSDRTVGRESASSRASRRPSAMHKTNTEIGEE